ncbi:MAG: hypothetical protein Q9226_006614, partial [Calogaya cf. arnoldii]
MNSTKAFTLPFRDTKTMSIARKWFVPDDEYLASVENYALVGTSALYVKNHFIDEPSESDLDKVVLAGSEPMFFDVLDHPICYNPRLVYADVDRDNEDHERFVKEAVKAGLVVESKKITEEKKKLFEYVIAHEYDCRSLGSESGDEEDLLEDEIKIDYVLQLKSEEARRRALTILSRQHRRKSPRPVLLLIGMIDKFSEGVKEGWLLGYDFYTNNIIIKPYHAVDGSQHPVAQKWDIELPNDGAEMKKNQESNLEDMYNDETYGFKLLAYHSITRWMRDHWDLLPNIVTTDGVRSLGGVENFEIEPIYDAMIEEMQEVPFPYKLQSKATLPTLKHMQVLLEDWERRVRRDAVEAKQAGEEDVAQNMAKLYEQLLGQLRSFDMGPRKPLMAAKPTEVGQAISDVAYAEGGTTKGSQSAQMQSELSKQRNFDQVSSHVGSKLETAPESIKKQDAQAVHRAETRVMGQQPPSGSISSVAQHQAAVNEGATGSTTNGATAAPSGVNGAPVEPNLRSQKDRQANFQDAASKVGGKLVNEPGNVTKEEADLLHSREQRAFG